MVLGWDSAGTPQPGGMVMFYDEGFASWGQRVQQVMGDVGMRGVPAVSSSEIGPMHLGGKGDKTPP